MLPLVETAFVNPAVFVYHPSITLWIGSRRVLDVNKDKQTLGSNQSSTHQRPCPRCSGTLWWCCCGSLPALHNHIPQPPSFAMTPSMPVTINCLLAQETSKVTKNWWTLRPTQWWIYPQLQILPPIFLMAEIMDLTKRTPSGEDQGPTFGARLIQLSTAWNNKPQPFLELVLIPSPSLSDPRIADGVRQMTCQKCCDGNCKCCV